jgi:hypothetical protein
MEDVKGGELTLTVSKANWQGLAKAAPQMREHDLLVVAASAHFGLEARTACDTPRPVHR